MNECTCGYKTRKPGNFNRHLLTCSEGLESSKNTGRVKTVKKCTCGVLFIMKECTCGFKTERIDNFKRHLLACKRKRPEKDQKEKIFTCTGKPGKPCPTKYSTHDSSHFQRHIARCASHRSMNKLTPTATSVDEFSPESARKRPGDDKRKKVFTCNGESGKPCPTKYSTSNKSNFRRHVARCTSHSTGTPNSVNESSPESATASLLQKVDEYFAGENMKRATCACCNELFAPLKMKSVPPSGNWLLRMRHRLKWEHTTHPVSDQTKQFYDVSATEPALGGVPLAKAGVVRNADGTVKVIISIIVDNYSILFVVLKLFYCDSGFVVPTLLDKFASQQGAHRCTSATLSHLQQFCCGSTP